MAFRHLQVPGGGETPDCAVGSWDRMLGESAVTMWLSSVRAREMHNEATVTVKDAKLKENNNIIQSAHSRLRRADLEADLSPRDPGSWYVVVPCPKPGRKRPATPTKRNLGLASGPLAPQIWDWAYDSGVWIRTLSWGFSVLPPSHVERRPSPRLQLYKVAVLSRLTISPRLLGTKDSILPNFLIH